MANLVDGLKASFTWRNAWHLGHFKWIILYVCIYVQEVTIQVAVLIRFSWNSHGWCGITHGWTLLFLETIGPIEPQIWGKVCPQNRFFVFKSDGLGFFQKKTYKLFLVPNLPKKKDYIHFCRPTPRSLKNGDAPKNYFSLIFWKILFFSKKMLNKKYSTRRCLRKRLYWFLLPCVALTSKEQCAPTNGFFPVFSKNTVFFEKLVLQ